jgi:hypothetical protein
VTLPTDYVGSDDTEDVDHAGMHNDVNAAVNAINAELGTNPSGASATVVARLDTLDTTVSGKESSGAAAAAVAAHEAALDPHSQYATDSALTSGLAGKSDTGHGHAAGDVSGLATVATSGAYSDLSGRPTLGTAAAAATTDFDPAGSAAAAQAAAIAASQPLDSDLTAIAALTTTSYGRAFLGLADAAAARSALALGSAATAASGDFEAAGAVAAHTGDTSDAHDASAISVDASGFNGNLAATDDTVQKVAQKVDDLALGGSGATVSSGTAAPSGGSDGDWYLRRTTGQWYEKVSGTWTLRERSSSAANLVLAAAAGSNYATAGGWSAGATGYYTFAGSTAQTQTLFSSQTGSPTFSGTSITVAGASLGAANAKAAIKGVREAYALFTIDTMPSAGRTLYVGLGMDFTYPFCYLGITNGGTATLYNGFGSTIKTLSGTFAAGDLLNFKIIGGALLVACTSSAYALRDQVLFASDLVSAAYIEAQGVQVLVGGDGKASLTILEVMP